MDLIEVLSSLAAVVTAVGNLSADLSKPSSFFMWRPSSHTPIKLHAFTETAPFATSLFQLVSTLKTSI